MIKKQPQIHRFYHHKTAEMRLKLSYHFVRFKIIMTLKSYMNLYTFYGRLRFF